MAKRQKQPKPDYSLKRRFFNQIGEPLDWKDYGLGIWTDLETIQRQIKVLASANRRVEIEFMKQGVLCGFDGKETGKSIIYEKR